MASIDVPVQSIANAVVPVVTFIASGFALRRFLVLDMRPVARVALYVFSPALVLSSLVAPKLSAHDIFGIVFFAVLMVGAALLISRTVGWLLHAPRSVQSGIDLVTVFSNSANLGLPMVAFSLGPSSLHAAVIFVLTQIVAVNTVGAYLAGRGDVNPRAALHRMLQLPSLWAMVVATVIAILHLHVPTSLLTASHFGGQAYPPTVLLVLGGTLADWQKGDFKQAIPWASVVARLLIMPAIAILVVKLLSLTATIAHPLVLQIAMPVAINAFILAQEFDAAPHQVGQTIALSTIGALLTTPLWLLVIPHFA